MLSDLLSQHQEAIAGILAALLWEAWLGATKRIAPNSTFGVLFAVIKAAVDKARKGPPAALLLLALLAAGCGPTAKTNVARASEAAIRAADTAVSTFLSYDAERELAIARHAIEDCKHADERPACIDREIAEGRAAYDKVRTPIADAVRFYREALRAAQAGLEGDIARAAGQLVALIAALIGGTP